MGKQKIQVGLVKLRKVTGKEPTYSCENCKCKRYSKCGCKRKSK